MEEEKLSGFNLSISIKIEPIQRSFGSGCRFFLTQAEISNVFEICNKSYSDSSSIFQFLHIKKAGKMETSFPIFVVNNKKEVEHSEEK